MPLTDLPPRSYSALIRQRLDEIDAAISQGVSREAVWEQLKKDHGLTMTFGTFKNALARARAKRRAAEEETENVDCTNQESETPSAANSHGGTEKGKKSHEPAQGKKGRILKRGEFAPEEGFDPSKYDTRYS